MMNEGQIRFKYHLENDESLRFFLYNKEWKEYAVSKITDELILSANAAIVSYPSGEAMFFYGRLKQLPKDITFNQGPSYTDNTPGYSKQLVKEGLGKVKIWHGDSISQDGDPRTQYSTSVKNESDRKIRVIKFAPFDKSLFGKLHLSGKYYSPTQFMEWFRVDDNEHWIMPGQTVCDPDNFGSGRGAWLYFFEDDLGERFIGEVFLERKL